MAKSKKNNYKPPSPPSELDDLLGDDSPEQRKKNVRRRARAEKQRLAKVPQHRGGTAAPKPYKKPSKEAIAEGQKEVTDLEEQALRDLDEEKMSVLDYIFDVDTRAEWDMGKSSKVSGQNIGGKRGQYRGADIPRRGAKELERRARKNPARGAHRGQSVGAQGEFSHGGSVDTTSPENEDYFARMTQKVYTSKKDKT